MKRTTSAATQNGPRLPCMHLKAVQFEPSAFLVYCFKSVQQAQAQAHHQHEDFSLNEVLRVALLTWKQQQMA